MQIHKSFKYRLLPTEDQLKELKQIAGNNRFVWNQLLEFTNSHKELCDKFLYRNDLQSYLIYLKQEYPFLYRSYSQSLQYHCGVLESTLKKAFDKNTIKERNKEIAKANQESNLEKRNNKLAKAFHYGFPKFKKKSNYSDTIHYLQDFKIKGNIIHIPKFGEIQFIKHRNIEGTPKNITISQQGENWYLSICCKIEIEEKEIKTENIIGIDLGLKTFASCSDGTEFKIQKNYRNKEKKLKRLQRVLSKRQKESNRRKRQQLKINKLHQVIRNQRQDFLHKTTHYLVKNYDGVALEDLSTKNMMKNHKLAKSIQDVSWFEFTRILKYKCQWYFKYFEQIDKYAPSSQICSSCGNKQKMELKDRIYNCQNCNQEIDRDYNASINILNFSKLTNTVGTTEINGQGEASNRSASGTVKSSNLTQIRS